MGEGIAARFFLHPPDHDKAGRSCRAQKLGERTRGSGHESSRRPSPECPKSRKPARQVPRSLLVQLHRCELERMSQRGRREGVTRDHLRNFLLRHVTSCLLQCLAYVLPSLCTSVCQVCARQCVIYSALLLDVKGEDNLNLNRARVVVVVALKRTPCRRHDLIRQSRTVCRHFLRRFTHSSACVSYKNKLHIFF